LSERRSSARHAIRLEATATVQGGTPHEVTVRDFCRGGMFLALSAPATGIGRGENITVRFSADDGHLFTLSGQVARVTDHGIGLAFQTLDVAAYRYLLDHAEAVAGAAAAADVAEIPSERRSLARAALRSRVERLPSDLVDRFVQRAWRRLEESEELARNNWRGLVEAQQSLKREQEQLTGRYHDILLTDYEAGGRERDRRIGQVPDAEAGLSLVDDDAFQDWLLVTALISRLEGHNEEALFELDRRMGAVFGHAVLGERNPLGPFMIVHGFYEPFQDLPLEGGIRNAVFHAFEEVALEQLPQWYRELNALLVEHGILPKVEREFTVIRPPDGAATPHGGAPEGVAAAEAERAAPERPTAVPADVSVAPSLSAAPPTGGVAVNPAGGATAAVTGAGGGYATARELLHLQREADARLHGRHPAAADTTTPRAGEQVYYSREELGDALARLADAGVSLRTARQKGGSLSGLLTDALAGEGGEARQLDSESNDRLELTESLLSSIQEDEILDRQLKQWLEGVELPLVRAALSDERILEDREHPLYTLFNTLDRLFRLLPRERTEERAALWRRVEQAMQRLVESEDQDPQPVAEAASELQATYSERMERFEQRAQAVAEACAAEPNQRHMMLEMLRDIDTLFDEAEGRRIPLVVLQIFDAGWKNLLWTAYSRQGPESRAYRSHRAVIEQALLRLTGRRGEGEGAAYSSDQLVSAVGQELARVAKDPTQVQPLVAQLGRELEVVRNDPSAVVLRHRRSIAGQILEAWERERLAKKPTALSVVQWRRWLERAERMAVGEMVAVKEGEGDTRQEKLVWSDPEWGRYVFVDVEGNRSLDLPLETLARDLAEGRILILEGWSRPLMDRASYAMLQSIHNRVLQEANRDSLTGLYNRRAFERHLETLLEQSKGGRRHMLLYLDIDRFNVINATCGHEAGDQMMSEVADLLREQLPAGATLGRLGGDEFAAVLEGADSVAGMAAANKVQAALHAYRFRCEGKEFSPTASFGLTTINPGEDTVRTLLSAVDAACLEAKEAGRNRIEFYDADSNAISQRRGIMEWVGRINTLFDQGLIRLKCQKIAPLRHPLGRPHYEVLLDVYDEAGNKVSLDQFVVSAERYDRILDIDRWVVGQVFDWLRRHRSRLDRVASLSVNLSARSVTDQPFMDELISRLAAGDLPTGQIGFEVTETAAIEDIDRAADLIRRLKRTGCRISLDDFGSGQASYAYLKSLPVDYLKIDGNFIRDMASNIYDYSVVKSIHEMGHALGKQTIAEYVEDEVTLSKLRKIGIDYVQGYVIERPIPLESLLPVTGE